MQTRTKKRLGMPKNRFIDAVARIQTVLYKLELLEKRNTKSEIFFIWKKKYEDMYEMRFIDEKH